MEYNQSILAGFNSWQLINAYVAAGFLIISPQGSASYVWYPKDSDDAIQSASYKVVLAQQTPGQVEFTYDVYVDGNEDVKKASCAIFGTSFDKVIKTSGHTAKSSIVTVKNLSDFPIVISDVQLCPEKVVTQILQSELSRYETHIVKYTNIDPEVISTQRELIANLNIELMEKSDLLLHVLINGVCSEVSTLTLELETNGTPVEYSPIEVDIQAGRFLIGIPGNIMQVPEGESRVKLYATLSAGTAEVQSKKIQVTLDGQNMVVIYGEDIWFGPSTDNDYDPCEWEVFIHEHPDISYIANGQLQVNVLTQNATPMSKTEELTLGTVYEHTFNHDRIKRYEEVKIT